MRLEIAAVTSDLALAEWQRGNVSKAEALWAQALGDVQPVFDADPDELRAVDRMASVRASLGSLCRSQRRFQEALAHYREALRARRRAAEAADAPAEARLARAAAQVDVARLLVDLLEVRPPGPVDRLRLGEAGALLRQAESDLRAAAVDMPGREDALAELDRQTQRLRRLESRRP
jgi:tetratricopeptide (TPR) repeat protein